MTFELLDNPLRLALEALIAVGSLVSTVAYISYRFSKLELKVNTLWDFLMRRAMTEAVGREMIDHPNSILSASVRLWFAGISGDLRNWYMREGVGKNDKELFILIEHKFGDRIVKEVCIPNHLITGSCLLAAIEIAKGN